MALANPGDAEDDSQGAQPDVKKVFISYSSADEKLHKDFLTHLSSLERSGKITIWHNLEILPGDIWENETQTHLNKADIILLLISSDFVASQYCWDHEVQEALARHQTGEVRVIPILLRATRWRDPPLAKLQALPRNAKPVTSWNNLDEAFENIVQDFEKVLKLEKEGARETALRKKLREFREQALTVLYKNSGKTLWQGWPGTLLLLGCILLTVYCINVVLSLFHIFFPAWVSILLVLCLALLCVVLLSREALKGSETVRERRAFLVFSATTLALLTIGKFLEQKGSLTQLRIGFKGGKSDPSKVGPFIDALFRELGIQVSSVFKPTHIELINALGNGELEMAWLGPADYLYAKQQYSAKTVLCNTGWNGNKTYQGYLISRTDGNIRTLDDLKGQTILMGDKYSTGGRILPLYELQMKGLVEGRDFDTSPSNVGPDVIDMVLNNKSLVGAITSDDYDVALSEHKIHEGDFRILLPNPPGSGVSISEGPFAVHSDLPLGDVLRIKDAFRTIADSDASIMKKMEIGGFATIDDNSYNQLYGILEELHLKLEDLVI